MPKRSADARQVGWQIVRNSIRQSVQTGSGSSGRDQCYSDRSAGRLVLIAVAIGIIVAWATPVHAGHTIEFSELSPAPNSTIPPNHPVFSYKAEVVPPGDPGFPHTMAIGTPGIKLEAWSPSEGWQILCDLLGVDPGVDVENTFEAGVIVATRVSVDYEVACSPPPLLPTGRIRVTAMANTPLPAIVFFRETWELTVEAPLPGEPPSALQIARLDPSSGGPSTQVTIEGSSFANGAQALFDGADVPTSRVSGEELRFTVPTDADCGEHDVQVANPERVTNAGILPPEFSNVVTFRVLCETPAPPPVALPRIDGFFPSDSGPPGRAIILRGSGFHAGSEIYWDGTSIDTEYIRDSDGPHLRFEVPSRTPCGDHDVGVLNPGPPRAKSNVVTFTVTSPCQGDGGGAPPPEEPDEPFFEAVSLDVPSTVSVGDSATFEGRVRNSGGAAGTANVTFLIDGDVIGETARSIAADETRTVTSSSYTFSQPGTYTVELRTPDEAISATVSVQAEPENAPPEDGGQTGLSTLDLNGNCVLETSEFLDAIDGWIDRTVPDDVLFDAIDAWIDESDVCTSTAGIEMTGPLAVAVRAQATDHAVRFSVRNRGVASISVRVFNLEGRAVFAETGIGSRLSWNLRGLDDEPVANGVYLYRVTVHAADGSVRQSDVKRLIMLR